MKRRCPTPCKHTARAWFDTPFNREVSRCHPERGQPGTRRVNAHMRNMHRKWPMGTVVRVLVMGAALDPRNAGPCRVLARDGVYYFEVEGKIAGHLRDNPHKAFVDWQEGVKVLGSCGTRVPFACMHRVVDGVHEHPAWMVPHDERIVAEKQAARAVRQAAMQRVFTMRRCCKECSSWFTITGSNHWYCGDTSCTKRRRRKDRAALKAARAPEPVQGSDAHLGRALQSGN